MDIDYMYLPNVWGFPFCVHSRKMKWVLTLHTLLS